MLIASSCYPTGLSLQLDQRQQNQQSLSYLDPEYLSGSSPVLLHSLVAFVLGRRSLENRGNGRRYLHRTLSRLVQATTWEKGGLRLTSNVVNIVPRVLHHLSCSQPYAFIHIRRKDVRRPRRGVDVIFQYALQQSPDFELHIVQSHFPKAIEIRIDRQASVCRWQVRNSA